MALSKEVLEQIAMAEAGGFDKLDLQPPTVTREAMKHAPSSGDPTQVGKVVNKVIPGLEIPIRVYIPIGDGPFAVISYSHGGGFVLMSIDTHDEICRQLCRATGCVVMSVDYRLAPENPYPEGPESAVAATRWMIENAALYSGDGTRMAVAGDSAGGYMALVVARQLTAQGIVLKAQFATYPVTDHYSAHHASWEENKDGFVLTAKIMKWFWGNYLQDPNKFEEASPLRAANFEGLPPAMIFTANYDPLRDEGRIYAEKLEAAGVPTIYDNFQNIHGFFGLGTMGAEALAKAAAFLKVNLNG